MQVHSLGNFENINDQSCVRKKKLLENAIRKAVLVNKYAIKLIRFPHPIKKFLNYSEKNLDY